LQYFISLVLTGIFSEELTGSREDKVKGMTLDEMFSGNLVPKYSFEAKKNDTCDKCGICASSCPMGTIHKK
jgi:ferredoxin